MAKNKKKSSDESEKETKKSVKDDSAKESKKSKKEENLAADSKESKKSKDNSEKKEPGKISKWFKDLKIEFKKGVWPSKETVVTNTSVVVGVIALSAILVGVLDEIFLILMRLIYNS